MSKVTHSLAPGKSVMGYALVLVLSGLLLTVSACSACDDLTSDASLSTNTVTDIAATTAVPASTTEPTATEGPTTPTEGGTSDDETTSSVVFITPTGASVVLMPRWTRFEEDDPYFAWGSGWTTGYSDLASGGEYRVSFGDAVVNFYFVGTRISLVAVTDSMNGIAKLTIDSGGPMAVDLYSPSLASTTVFTSPVLTNGTHSVRLEWIGDKNPASTGTFITFDAVDVIGAVVD